MFEFIFTFQTDNNEFTMLFNGNSYLEAQHKAQAYAAANIVLHNIYGEEVNVYGEVVV